MKLPDKIETLKDDVDVEELHSFYTYSTEKENEKMNIKISFPRHKFIDLCEKLNIYRFITKDEGCTYILVENQRSLPVGIVGIQDVIIKFFQSLPERTITIEEKAQAKFIEVTINFKKLRAAFINSSSTLLSRKATHFSFLPTTDTLEFLKDTWNKKYIYFNNCVVECSADGMRLLPYSEINTVVWENSIINRDFAYTDKKGDFEQFFDKITGNSPERKKSLMSAIGYLLHNYYEYDLRAVFLLDVNENMDSRAGGTSKGVIGKALAQILNRDVSSATYVSVPGSEYNFEDKNKYSSADISTQIVHIEDVKSTFKPEYLVNDITEGIYIKRMYENPYQRLSKMMVSSNFSLDFDSPTTRRRAYAFELANYYSDKLRPSDEFRWFFGREWNETTNDWNEFYSFMIRCCLIFIKEGLLSVPTVNNDYRVIVEQSCEDFAVWFTELIKPDRERMVEYKKDVLFDWYLAKYQSTLAAYKKPKDAFFKWIRLYCRKKSIPIAEYRSTDDLIYIYADGATIARANAQKNKIKE